jgi:hypothetical protein
MLLPLGMHKKKGPGAFARGRAEIPSEGHGVVGDIVHRCLTCGDGRVGTISFMGK